jgi:nicotinate-nucleotide adenylyltransferase
MPKARSKIGLLGGSFDPPHLAHLVLAQTALEELDLDEIWFLPSYIPPHKKNRRITPYEHRQRMLRLSVQRNRRFKVVEVEKRKGGISYTVESLALLRKKHPGFRFYLILGSDNLAILSTAWKEPKKVFSLAVPVFARRPNGKARPPGWLKRVVWLHTPMLDISSTALRARVKAGRSIRHLVPAEVERYILSKRLYR